jgi:hypothetical protein
VRIVIVRRRGEGSELSSRSYLGQCDAIQRNDRRRDSREHRIQSGRSEDRGFWLQASNQPCRQGFSAAAGLRRGVLSGSGGEGSTAHDEAVRPSEGVLGKD